MSTVFQFSQVIPIKHMPNKLLAFPLCRDLTELFKILLNLVIRKEKELKRKSHTNILLFWEHLHTPAPHTLHSSFVSHLSCHVHTPTHPSHLPLQFESLCLTGFHEGFSKWSYSLYPCNMSTDVLQKEILLLIVLINIKVVFSLFLKSYKSTSSQAARTCCCFCRFQFQ